jgi:hypothetical protein
MNSPRNAGDEIRELATEMLAQPPLLVTREDIKNYLDRLDAWSARQVREAPEKVDRFEVIDDTGRAYVKGSIYGTPVKVELSYQDDGRTLKVFVSAREAITDSGTVATGNEKGVI